ncbi:hypothetical protein GIB67_032881 [Kingdonia uniflora]|uniref:Uncharacterized protein n=1 Tax=Kingdonia uniflora TaxID=39325 RepID=A0A7J7NC38_9MAGN|nr:hypothetical protein GIB67_032881 [Kingdonia uniflora]
MDNFGNPRRILQWFDNFAGVGESEHKNGARAISQFAFVNRDICWEKLEWRGKHGQSPAVVATKPLYFLDLDVQRTVENFLENVPEFWSSNELADSVKDGEIFLTDTEFFIDCFIDLMFEEDSKEVWKVIHEFLIEETFTVLCHHLLPIIEERDLRNFLDSLWKFHSVRMESKFFGHPSFWLQILLFVYNSFVSIDELLLLNAVINQGRQVLRLVRDKEHREQKRKIENLVLEMRTSSGISDALLIKECLNMDQAEAMKLLGLQSWVLHYRLSEECKTPDSWEALFTESKISFSKSNEYDLVSVDGFSEESQPDSGDDVSIGVKKKRKAKNRKKRRRRNRGHDNQNENELLDLGGSSAWHGLQSRTGSWMLSTDDYTSSWNSVHFLTPSFRFHCLFMFLHVMWIFTSGFTRTPVSALLIYMAEVGLVQVEIFRLNIFDITTCFYVKKPIYICYASRTEQDPLLGLKNSFLLVHSSRFLVADTRFAFNASGCFLLVGV